MLLFQDVLLSCFTGKGKGLDKATLSEDRYISRRLQKQLGGTSRNRVDRPWNQRLWANRHDAVPAILLGNAPKESLP
jgi:hypothetical protein